MTKNNNRNNYVSKRTSGWTYDYDLFIPAPGNRKILDGHVLKTHDSIIEFGNLSAINCIKIPNPIGKAIYEIVDGQHRYEALKSLNEPIEYDVWDIPRKSMIPLNQNTKNWTLYDYLHYGVINDKEDYIILKKYIEETGIGISALIELLGQKEEPGYHKGRNDLFKKLRWRIEDEDAVKNILSIVQDLNLKFSVKHYNHLKFILAFRDVYNLPQYDHEEMMKQISKCSQKLTQQASRADYIKNFEDVYNFNKSKLTIFPIKKIGNRNKPE